MRNAIDDEDRTVLKKKSKKRHIFVWMNTNIIRSNCLVGHRGLSICGWGWPLLVAGYCLCAVCERILLQFGVNKMNAHTKNGEPVRGVKSCEMKEKQQKERQYILNQKIIHNVPHNWMLLCVTDPNSLFHLSFFFPVSPLAGILIFFCSLRNDSHMQMLNRAMRLTILHNIMHIYVLGDCDDAHVMWGCNFVKSSKPERERERYAHNSNQLFRIGKRFGFKDLKFISHPAMNDENECANDGVGCTDAMWFHIYWFLKEGNLKWDGSVIYGEGHDYFSNILMRGVMAAQRIHCCSSDLAGSWVGFRGISPKRFDPFPGPPKNQTANVFNSLHHLSPANR